MARPDQRQIVIVLVKSPKQNEWNGMPPFHRFFCLCGKRRAFAPGLFSSYVVVIDSRVKI